MQSFLYLLTPKVNKRVVDLNPPPFTYSKCAKKKLKRRESSLFWGWGGVYFQKKKKVVPSWAMAGGHWQEMGHVPILSHWTMLYRFKPGSRGRCNEVKKCVPNSIKKKVQNKISKFFGEKVLICIASKPI